MNQRDLLFPIMSDIALAVQAVNVYPEGHHLVRDSLVRLRDRIADLTGGMRKLHIAFLGDNVVIDEEPFVGVSPTLSRLIARMRERGIERIVFREGVDLDELARFARVVGGAAEDDGKRWEWIEFGKVGGIPSGARPAGHGTVPAQDRFLGGLEEAARELFHAIRAERRDAGGRNGPDIVSVVLQGVSKAEFLVDQLMILQGEDEYAIPHSLNVCMLVVALAMRLGLPEAFVRDAGMAALLHDIGMERIPPEIVRKKGKLELEEFARMTRHPELGARLLRNFAPGSGLPMIVAFQHHIRHDLKGYPTVRFFRERHPASCMTQIADIYDALRTDRPYRPSLDRETALSIMKGGRGTEFDPFLLDRFVDLVG